MLENRRTCGSPAWVRSVLKALGSLPLLTMHEPLTGEFFYYKGLEASPGSCFLFKVNGRLLGFFVIPSPPLILDYKRSHDCFTLLCSSLHLFSLAERYICAKCKHVGYGFPSVVGCVQDRWGNELARAGWRYSNRRTFAERARTCLLGAWHKLDFVGRW